MSVLLRRIHPALRRFLLPLSAVVWLTGCVEIPVRDPAIVGPFFQPANVVGEPFLGGIRRVVLLPVCGGTVAAPETVAALDPVFTAALQRENRFEVVTLSREQCRRKFQTAELSSAAALPPAFLDTLRREFAADAVLFIDVTVYRPYLPLALGLRAKLASLDGSRVVWSFDNVFASEAPAVANAARRHFFHRDGTGVPADASTGVLQSPSRFATYAAAAMFTTLPPVTPSLVRVR